MYGGGVFAPPQKKTFNYFFLQNYNVAHRSLRNVNTVTIVNKFELLSAYECIAGEYPISNVYR